MRKIKLVALALVFVIMMPILASCTKVKEGPNRIRKDDPWYETTKFELEMDIGPNDQLSDTVACVSDKKIFYTYCHSKDGWGSSTTTLDTYNFDGKLLNRQEVICPDGGYIGRIYSVKAAPDGKTIDAIVHIICNGLSEASFAKIDTKNGKISDLKPVFSGRAKTFKGESSVSDISNVDDYTVALVQEGPPSWSYKMLLFKDTEFVTELDMKSVNIYRMLLGYSIDLSSNSLFASGIENGGVITMEFDLNSGKLKNKTTFQESDDNSINFAEYTTTGNGELCKIDSLGNIIKIDINSMMPQTVIDTNWYIPEYFTVGVDGRSGGADILSCTDDMTVILRRQITNYEEFKFYYSSYITVLKKASKNPNAGKEIIEIALPENREVSEYLSKSIYEFNQSDNEYFIRAWKNYKSGFTIGRNIGPVEEDEMEVYEMIQDLKGPDAPDLAVGIQKNYAMRDDVFMDLSDFLDADVMDKQFSNIFEAGRIDGKLYFLPVTIEIEGLVTNENLLEDGAVGLTFEEYDKLVKEDMSGFSPYDHPFSVDYNKKSFILSCIDTLSAIDGDKVDFGTDQFRTAVEYAKNNFEYDDEASMPLEYSDNWMEQNKDECYYTKIDNYLEFVYACNSEEGHYKIIGTPSVDASGPRFKCLESISVSVSTDVVDGCRKFLNYLFSGSAFENDECEFRQIITNKEIMNRNIEMLTAKNNEADDLYTQAKLSGSIMYTSDYEKATGIKRASDDMKDSFFNSMSTISTYYYEDNEIVKFVFEELAPYLADDRSLDDAVTILNDRVSKYVSEM